MALIRGHLMPVRDHIGFFKDGQAFRPSARAIAGKQDVLIGPPKPGCHA
jgi:hypothetical protein